MTSFLSGIGDRWVNDEGYESLMEKYPLLRKCINGTRLPDGEHIRAAFLCAGYAYLSHRPKLACSLVRALLDCNDVPVEISCAGSIFLALITLDMNDFQYAANILQTLVTVPQWIESSDALKNSFALVNTRINLKKDITYKCPELTGRKLEDIEWLSIRLESGLRDGSYKTVLKPLMELRKIARDEQLVKVDMILGDLYFRGFENLDVAETFYKEAIGICYLKNITIINLLRPIVQINAELGAIMMCNNKPFSAFYTMLIGLPAVANTPEGWMKLAQIAILCHGNKDLYIRETKDEVDAAKDEYNRFYEIESNRKILNEIVKEEFIKNKYSVGNGNGATATDPEPNLNFAFKCVRMACSLVQDNLKEYVYLQFDLMTMYVYLSIELKNVASAVQILNTSVKMNRGGALNRNIYAIFRARFFLTENKLEEAVNELNSIVYPNEESRKLRPNRENNYCQSLEVLETESCYDHSFAFITIESMRLKFLYNVIKTRNECRKILNEKCAKGLKHAADKNVFIF